MTTEGIKGLNDSPTNRVMLAVNSDGRVQFSTQCVPPHLEEREEARIREQGYEVLWVSLPELRAAAARRPGFLRRWFRL